MTNKIAAFIWTNYSHAHAHAHGIIAINAIGAASSKVLTVELLYVGHCFASHSSYEMQMHKQTAKLNRKFPIRIDAEK